MFIFFHRIIAPVYFDISRKHAHNGVLMASTSLLVGKMIERDDSQAGFV